MATTFSRSHSCGFPYLVEMKCLVYETPIDTPEELVARVTKAAAIICETQSFARRYQLCINVNGRHFQLLQNHPASNLSSTPSEETENLSNICHITKGLRFISSTNPQGLYTEFFYTLYAGCNKICGKALRN